MADEVDAVLALLRVHPQLLNSIEPLTFLRLDDLPQAQPILGTMSPWWVAFKIDSLNGLNMSAEPGGTASIPLNASVHNILVDGERKAILFGFRAAVYYRARPEHFMISKVGPNVRGQGVRPVYQEETVALFSDGQYSVAGLSTYRPTVVRIPDKPNDEGTGR